MRSTLYFRRIPGMISRVRKAGAGVQGDRIVQRQNNDT
jgi:hypothetical protein